MNKYVLAIFLVAILKISFAQDSTSRNLNEIVVKEKLKVAKERGEFKRHAQSVEALSEEDLNRNNPAFIEQSLGTMAGVQVDKRTQLGGQRIVIRGYGNDQKFNNWGIKAYYNGVPLTTADGVTVLDDIDFSIVNNIEVVKGPAATMYGGGVGGVARFYIKPLENKGLTLTEKVAVGSFGLFQSNTRLDFVNEKTAMFLSYGHLQSDGYRPRGNSLKNYFAYMGEFKIGIKHLLSVYASQNYSHENVTGQISYADYYAGIDNGNAAYASKNARNNYLTTRFSISDNFMINKNLSNRTSLFYFNQDLENVSAAAVGNSISPNFGLRSVFALKNKFKDNIYNELNVGLEIQQSRSLATSWRFLGTDDANPLKLQDISKGSYFKYITNQSAYFVHNRLNLDQYDMALIVGLSVNNINYSRNDLLAGLGLVSGYNKDLSYTKTFNTSYNPHLAFQKTIKKQIINLSYSEGYNAPTASTAFIGTINKTNDNLLPEKAKMIDLGIQGLFFNSRLDYQLSIFAIDVKNKLTQLSGATNGGTYSYWANTGHQLNKGMELSLSYLIFNDQKSNFIKRIEPFFNASYYQFKYNDFKTNSGSTLVDYSNKEVVGVPKTKYTLGLDINLNAGFYLNNTYNYMGSVYTDFANTNLVKGFGLLNAKLGYKRQFKKLELDLYMAANNLTNQINYTFLFLGNNINDSDTGNGYPKGVSTDVNPGPSKAYWFSGINLKYKF